MASDKTEKHEDKSISGSEDTEPVHNLRARFRGCLLGLAAGDAVGTTLEFRKPGSFEPINDMVGGGPFNLAPGQWTDDTSMALCLAESLATLGDFDAEDQMQRYVRWYRDGHLSSNGFCFDIGATVSGALQRFEQSGEPYAGSTRPDTAGNGSIMRLAPVVLFYFGDALTAVQRAADSSRTTHGAREAVDGCRYLAGVLLGALAGLDKGTILASSYAPAPGYGQETPLAPAIAEIAGGSFKHRDPPQIKGTGYVVRSLEAALWAFYHSQNFQDGCLLAANLGDDADTTAAVYGQVAGAYYSDKGIPRHWREQLALRDTITTLADRLFAHSQRLHIS